MRREGLRKILSILMAAVMLLSMSVTGFAATASANSGTITIEDSETVSVAGKTFNAYQILELTAYVDNDGDVETNGYVYTVPDALISFYSAYFSISTTVGDFSASVRDAIAALSDDSVELYVFATAALAAAKDAGITPSTKTANTDDKYVSFTDLALGYYLIEDAGTTDATNETISAVMLDTTATSVTIKLKAETPTLDKTITKTDDTNEADETKVNNVAVGGTVTYELTSTVPDMRGYTTYFFVVNDTLSKGLTYAIKSETDNNMVVQIGTHTLECASITVDGSEVSVTTPTSKYTYDLVITNNDDDGTTAVKVIFKDFIQYADETGSDITITYTVTVNEDAEIGNTSNDNTATLVYSNNPNEESSGSINPDEPGSSDPVGETTETVTKTYVTGIKLKKVDPDNEALTGAVFTLAGDALKQVQVSTEVFTPDDDGTYWLLNDGTYTTTDPATEGIDTSAYADISTKYSKSIDTDWVTTSSTVEATATVDDTGVLVFNGLSAGEYTITEIVSPDGYNLLDAPITITIAFDNSESATARWSVSSEDDTEEVKVASVNTDGIIELTVVNEAGTKLPSTGGMGTKIFHVAGIVLMLGAAVLLITRKRMGKME